ncbi:MAG: RluA family pseudouridine synthase [Patescibacteria group bacterium]|jgi:23S rRNA pseudouridine1911/1915/1917 synthase
MKYRIKKISAGERLDKFLTAKKKNLTRSDVVRLIESGMVLLNGKVPSKHQYLKEDDIVDLDNTKKKVVLRESMAKSEPEIIFENNDFLVINKPAGLIVHGATHIKEKTLADWLLQKYPELKKVGENSYRPGMMHRLDKEASGLIVVAKNNETFFALKKQFQDRLIEKEYLALVYGDVSKESDKIDFPIKRAIAGYRQAAFPDKYEEEIEEAGELRQAHTEFSVSQRFLNYTLLRVKIKSGRKHQIRVHFYAYGHPLVGDDLYSTRRTKSLNKKLKLERIFLVSTFLSFADATGKRYEFNLPLPLELEEFLKKIK